MSEVSQEDGPTKHNNNLERIERCVQQTVDRRLLESQRDVLGELSEHRKYISSISKFTAAAAIGILGLLAAILIWTFGKTIQDAVVELTPSVGERVENAVKNEIATNLDIKLEVRNAVDSALKQVDIQGLVNRNFEQATQDELVSTILQDENLKSLVSKSLPTGSVVAFDLSSCPAGWSEYSPAQGRSIIGAGARYRLGQAEGKETHSLSVNELPPHTHQAKHLPTARGSGNGVVNWGSGGNPSTVNSGVGPTGEGKEFSLMSPWIALTYCIRVD